MRAKLGVPKAITAAAHKLARIVFHMLSTRQAYDETIVGRNERQFRVRAEARLRAQAKALGYSVVAAVPATAGTAGSQVSGPVFLRRWHSRRFRSRPLCCRLLFWIVVGAPAGTVPSNRDCGHAICVGCPGTPRGIRDRRRSFLCGSRCGDAAGNPVRCTPSGATETSTAGSSSYNSSNAFRPLGRCRIGLKPRAAKDLETHVEYLPRPRQWSRPTTRPGKMRAF
jgi:hypothetical protein